MTLRFDNHNEQRNLLNFALLPALNIIIISLQVKVDLFREGQRKAWFLFDGIASSRTDWFSQSRLIASPYSNLKTGSFMHFSVEGQAIHFHTVYLIPFTLHAFISLRNGSHRIYCYLALQSSLFHTSEDYVPLNSKCLLEPWSRAL